MFDDGDSEVDGDAEIDDNDGDSGDSSEVDSTMVTS